MQCFVLDTTNRKIDGGQIARADIGLDLGEAMPVDNLDLRKIREDAEKRAVIAALARMDGNVAKAADVLGVSRPTLYDLMTRFGLK